MKKIISVILFISILGACTTKSSSKIEGTWKTNGDCNSHLGEGLEFKSNGSLSIMDGESYTQWELNEDETKMYLSNPKLGIRDIYHFKMINENTIELVKENYTLDCQLIKE